MAFYLVRAKPKGQLLELRNELDSGKIEEMKPFGNAMRKSLENARIDGNSGYIIWIEEDYCSPPLKMERESVLDRYFDELAIEQVSSEEDGWSRIEDKPLLWSKR